VQLPPSLRPSALPRYRPRKKLKTGGPGPGCPPTPGPSCPKQQPKSALLQSRPGCLKPRFGVRPGIQNNNLNSLGIGNTILHHKTVLTTGVQSLPTGVPDDRLKLRVTIDQKFQQVSFSREIIEKMKNWPLLLKFHIMGAGSKARSVHLRPTTHSTSQGALLPHLLLPGARRGAGLSLRGRIHQDL